MEADFGDQYDQIDVILDKIPEFHKRIDVKPLVPSRVNRLMKKGSNPNLMMQKLFSGKSSGRGSASLVRSSAARSPEPDDSAQTSGSRVVATDREMNYASKVNSAIQAHLKKDRSGSRSLSSMALMYQLPVGRSNQKKPSQAPQQAYMQQVCSMPYNNKQKRVPAVPIFSKNNVSSDITQEVSDLTSVLQSAQVSNCEIEHSACTNKRVPHKINRNNAVLRLKMEQILASENVDDSGVGAI